MKFSELLFPKIPKMLSNQVRCDEFTALLQEAKVFLVEKDFHSGESTDINSIESTLIDIPLPFKTCFFEMNHKEFSLMTTQNAQGIRSGGLYGILAHEVSPGEILLLGAADVGKDNDCKSSIIIGRITKDKSETEPLVLMMVAAIAKLCRYIHGCNLGVEFVFKSIGMRTKRQGKFNHKIESIIRLSPKSRIDYPVPSIGKSIDWSQRWWVRGHWRKHSGGTGKDRSGNYSVNGFTWVSEHLRGPDSAPIKKSIYQIPGDMHV